MDPISSEFLDELIDFSPPDTGVSKSVGDQQREGTLAAFNMLARNGCAYLADEVGMGKTYMALGVMTLLRYFDPHARVIVIAPRQNIQEKWRKELTNFVRTNWKIVGNRVKSLERTPVWEPVICGNLPTFAHEALLNQDRDFFLRMTSFSLTAKNYDDRKRSRNLLVQAITWLNKRDINTSSPKAFLDTYAIALNSAVPDADLLIVDEAHNLKHGFGERVSNRNRVMGLAFGHPDGKEHKRDWYKRKARRVLFLSATPFEDDYAAIHRQLQIFGFGDVQLTEPGSQESLRIDTLSDPHADPLVKKRIVERLLIRRTSGLMIAGQKYTKNMYRREWRKGGIATYDQPIRIEDPETRLIVALVQKKVSEVLQTEKFRNSFQIGMLSSFESFSQDLTTALRQDREQNSSPVDGELTDRGSKFDDAEQQTRLSQEERDGIDSNAVAQIVHSFETHFHRRLPHPKLDRISETLKDMFQSGEKALIFVRRVATVGELAGKLNLEFDSWLQHRMETFLPALGDEIKTIFARYRQEHQQSRLGNLPGSGGRKVEAANAVEEARPTEQRSDLEPDDDKGGVRSFFEWFFRGFGPPGMLSGAAFQKNRLTNVSSIYSTIFEDNYVADLLQVDPSETLTTLARTLDVSTEGCVEQLREIAYSYFDARHRQKEGYPRVYVHESYQVAGLTLLSHMDGAVGRDASIVLQERYPDTSIAAAGELRRGFPSPEALLATETIFTELKKQRALRDSLWPLQDTGNFRIDFRRREQRRELFSALARLGSAYIDLYMLAIKDIGAFTLGLREQEEGAELRLIKNFVTLLAEQREQNGFHAFRELSETAQTFDTLVAVNFPDLEQQSLRGLTRYFGIALGRQVPVGEVSGQVNKRVVAQFRMPGFPLALVSTDVLQEGEDLHTFCKRVLHYGIAWTPSSIEQRTGRIDRIGGLVQRNLDSRPHPPVDEELIQVFYPHLRDTVELLQVRRVLRRLNRFLELMHQEMTQPDHRDSTIDADRAMLDEMQDVPQYTKPLKSAFEVKPHWLDGELGASDVNPPDWEARFSHFHLLQTELGEKYDLRLQPSRSDHEFEGRVNFDLARHAKPSGSDSLQRAEHDFVIRLKSHVAGEQTLLQCESPVAETDLNDIDNMNELAKLLSASDGAKICVEPRVTRTLDRIFVRQEILFDLEVSKPDDLCHLFENVVPTAAKLSRMFYSDSVNVD